LDDGCAGGASVSSSVPFDAACPNGDILSAAAGSTVSAYGWRASADGSSVFDAGRSFGG